MSKQRRWISFIRASQLEMGLDYTIDYTGSHTPVKTTLTAATHCRIMQRDLEHVADVQLVKSIAKVMGLIPPDACQIT